VWGVGVRVKGVWCRVWGVGVRVSDVLVVDVRVHPLWYRGGLVFEAHRLLYHSAGTEAGSYVRLIGSCITQGSRTFSDL